MKKKTENTRRVRPRVRRHYLGPAVDGRNRLPRAPVNPVPAAPVPLYAPPAYGAHRHIVTLVTSRSFVSETAPKFEYSSGFHSLRVPFRLHPFCPFVRPGLLGKKPLMNLNLLTTKKKPQTKIQILQLPTYNVSDQLSLTRQRTAGITNIPIQLDQTGNNSILVSTYTITASPKFVSNATHPPIVLVFQPSISSQSNKSKTCSSKTQYQDSTAFTT